jgi:hypothetical protein
MAFENKKKKRIEQNNETSNNLKQRKRRSCHRHSAGEGQEETDYNTRNRGSKKESTYFKHGRFAMCDKIKENAIPNR